jgi:predicted CXXCH cytochrome family protein
MEWLVLLATVAIALIPLWNRFDFRKGGTLVYSGAILLAAVAGAAFFQVHLRHKVASRHSLRQMTPATDRGEGYVTSDTCRACHPDQYHSWHQSYHRSMTQYPQSGTVMADFANVTLEVDGDPYRLTRSGDEFWAEMVDPDWRHDRALAMQQFRQGQRRAPPPPEVNPPRVKKRISLTTGSHHFQAFWVASDQYRKVQFAFPFAWLTEERRWVPRKDTFVRDPSATSPIQIWNMNCIKCHSSAGQPGKSDFSADLLSRVGELGIACESCHGPAANHVKVNRNPWRRYARHASAKPDPTIVNPKRLDSRKATYVCGQCHSVSQPRSGPQWLKTGSSYRPGDDLIQTMPLILPRHFDEFGIPQTLRNDDAFLNNLFWPDGIIRVTGRELSGLYDSACYQKGTITCLSCHSMHQSLPDDQLAARMETNEACYQCHPAYRENLEKHTHHISGSTGSLCYNCHMPMDTYGLLKAVRSHYIGKPSVQTTQATGRPNACNLCHLDKSLAWTGRYLNQWYALPKPALDRDESAIAAAVLWTLKGDAAQRALLAWVYGWEPARKASGEEWTIPYLGLLHEDPYPAIRCIAHRSLQAIPPYGEVPYDFLGEPRARAQSRAAILRVWRDRGRDGARDSNPAVLLRAGRSLDEAEIQRLLGQRNLRPVDLIE